MNKRGLFIGQAPPEKNYDIPFSRTRLYSWFDSIGVDQSFVLDSFEFEALVEQFPGKCSKGHKLPSDFSIQNHIPRLIKKMESNSIKLVIPIGKLAIQYVLKTEEVDLGLVVGSRFQIKPFGATKLKKTVIPLPHPSGLNTWIFQNNNQSLLKKALDLIKEELYR